MNNQPHQPPKCTPGRRQTLAVAVVLLFAAAGCGTKLHPVRGHVTYPDGKPITEGMVVFESLDPPRTARGEIGADGSYQLGTNRPGDGALLGKYRVLVAPKSDPNAVDKPKRPPPFDPRFMEFSTSGLEFEVTAAGPNEFPIQVAKHLR